MRQTHECNQKPFRSASATHSCLVAKSASEWLTTCKSALNNTHIHLERIFRRSSRCGSCLAERLFALWLAKASITLQHFATGPACAFPNSAYVRHRTYVRGTDWRCAKVDSVISGRAVPATIG